MGSTCGTGTGDDRGAPGPQPRSTKVWVGVGTDGFVFPELRTTKAEGGVDALKTKPNFAICLSGGGFRATTCALGWIRTLYKADLLRHARYMTSNSGGSWFNSAFNYRCPGGDRSPTKFLGSFVPPENLTPDAAKNAGNEEGTYAKAVSDASFMKELMLGIIKDLLYLHETLGNRIFKDTNKVRAWSDAVGTGFLRPFGIDDEACCFAMHGDEDRVMRGATGISKVATACADPGMPFPIVVGSIAPKNDPKGFHPVEFTPLYSGVPASIPDAGEGGKQLLGGVLLDNFGFTSEVPADPLPKPNGPADLMNLTCSQSICLKQVVGVSSSYIAQMLVDSKKEMLWELAGCPELTIFNSAGGSSEMPFADGGGVDNLAIHAALRRGVTKLLVCAANPEPPYPLTDAQLFTSYNCDMSGLFGAHPKGCIVEYGGGTLQSEVWNKHIQVFETGQWDNLLKKMSEAASNAVTPGLVWAKMKLKVLTNKDQGIRGGYEADVMFVFNSMSSKWESSLPQAGQSFVKKDIESFPFIPTSKLDYEPELTGYLSNLCAYNMLQLIDEVKSLIGPRAY